MSVSAEDQIEFLGKIQRLIAETSYVSTYKYALLKSLADLAVEKGHDSSGKMKIHTREIAEKFIQYYWPQVSKFPAKSKRVILKQNTGPQAAIINKIGKAKELHTGSISKAIRSPDYGKLVTYVNGVVKSMPLWKLQNVNGKIDDFLYANTGSGDEITLKRNVGYCLRTFHGLISDLVQNGWLTYIRRNNYQELGTNVDLMSFLFGSERNSLAKLVEPLRDLQGNQCFYCHKAIKASPDVDHFIPWSRYKVDLVHNFVLTHSSCNRSKSDHLASLEHLENWVTRTHKLDGSVAELSQIVGFPSDLVGSLQISEWAYLNAANVGSSGWFKGREFRLITHDFVGFF